MFQEICQKPDLRPCSILLFFIHVGSLAIHYNVRYIACVGEEASKNSLDILTLAVIFEWVIEIGPINAIKILTIGEQNDMSCKLVSFL